MFYNFSKSMSCFNQGYFHDAVAGGCKNYYSPFSFLIDGCHSEKETYFKRNVDPIGLV